jgi:3-deoxy-alpha-D-manno-octulosonate 8-oxidase
MGLRPAEGFAVFFVDDFFEAASRGVDLGADGPDLIISVPTEHEPSTTSADSFTAQVRDHSRTLPVAIVGFGGGITMDTAKAVSNLLTNGGTADRYQGWDLLPMPGVHKIGVPTISGTGAESSRTCVLSNARTGAKLGMNSKFSLFNSIVLDPTFSESVPRDQYFYTGMDTYMHCIESLGGRFRNVFADALSRESLRLVRSVFNSDDMMSFESRMDLMTASCLGGMAIAGSYVGLIHPMSAALSIVLGTHHGVANCIAMRAMKDYYPTEYEEFWAMADRQGVEIPTVNGASLTQSELDGLVASTLVHERPLSNALGLDFGRRLGSGRLMELFALL